MSEDIQSRKSFFTPCRSVGLKRRSIGTPSLAQNSVVSPAALVTETRENISTPKRVIADASERMKVTSKKFKNSLNDNESIALVTDIPSSVNETENLKCEEMYLSDLDTQITATKARISKIQDQIKSLESIALNAKQHDVQELNELIHKWRKGCQEALNDLLTEYKSRDVTCSMLILLNKLGIPVSLVHYSEVENDFYE